MAGRADYSSQLRARAPVEWGQFLLENSGLPGPRGNLELADAFTAVADRATILRLVSRDEEYLRFCGTEALGRLILEEPGAIPRSGSSSESERPTACGEFARVPLGHYKSLATATGPCWAALFATVPSIFLHYISYAGVHTCITSHERSGVGNAIFLDQRPAVPFPFDALDILLAVVHS